MLIYKDLISGNEMFGDTYKVKLVDEVIYEVFGKLTTQKSASFVLEGANASAEEAEEGLEEGVVSGVDIVIAHRLVETHFDKKGYTVYLKDYMKRLIVKLEELKTPAETISLFKTNVNKSIMEILKRFKELQFFTGESMDPDGMVALMEYRDIDGQSIPVLMCFKHGLLEEKF